MIIWIASRELVGAPFRSDENGDDRQAEALPVKVAEVEAVVLNLRQ